MTATGRRAGRQGRASAAQQGRHLRGGEGAARAPLGVQPSPSRSASRRLRSASAGKEQAGPRSGRADRNPVVASLGGRNK